MEESDIDLRIAGTRDAVLMVECGANEVKEEVMVEALTFGHQALQPLIDAQFELAEMAGKAKTEVPRFLPDPSLEEKVNQIATDELVKIFEQPYEKANMYGSLSELEEKLVTEIAGDDETLNSSIHEAYDDLQKKIVRNRILDKGIRPDGRNTKEIRPIWCEVGISPKAHGSGLFTRGETQALTLATLGTPREAQELDSLNPAESKRYMHHYNFPPYCVGEVRMLRGSSRREIGHGALAERALLPVIPPESEFPYTMRLVSEILSSNGSSSMASVCGSTLALMDTGVPIKAPVAGVAMGLIKEGERYSILTDIMGMEDHLGDMDFKVAGTQNGITALQMDIKIKGITTQIMSEALQQALNARLNIMEKMLEIIPAPREELKPHVPRITIIKIPVDKIGAIIGPGGKTIRSIQEETNTQIDIQDEGYVYVASSDSNGASMALERIEALTEVPQIGHIYTGKTVRVTDFGAFVEILPNIDGMVHISQLDSERVERVEDIVQVGDEITVMVTAIDENGKIRLSRQAVLEGWTAEEAIANENRGRGGSRSGGNRRSGGGRSGSNRNSRDRGGRR
jgi:polyribonucleotide nucleotidyltransferase